MQVARTGSVKGAAEELALSAPALSRRIQALERFLGFSLFDRRHQQLEINKHGQRLLSEIAPALDALSAAIDVATSGVRALRIRLSVLPLFVSQRLFPRLGELRKAHPELHLDVDTSPNPLARLGDGPRRRDRAGARRRSRRSMPGSWTMTRVYSHRGARARTEGPQQIRRPEDVARETVLIHRDMATTFDVWKAAVGLPDLQPASIDYYDSGALMLEAAARDLGIAVMHGRHLHHAQDERIARLFDQHIESPYRYFFVCVEIARSNPAPSGSFTTGCLRPKSERAPAAAPAFIREPG